MPPRKSFTDRKEAWAAKMREKLEGQAALRERSTDRLPPGQHQSKTLPVLDLGIHPEVPLEEWRLQIGGEVEEELTLDWDALSTFPQTERASDFHCVTTWSQFDVTWGGIAMTELIERVRPLEGAEFVSYACYDGYTTNTRIEPLADLDSMLALRLDGRPLPLRHGGPARVVVPALYAWKSPKFVRRIDFRSQEALGYWEKRGYSNDADPWLEERFSSD